MILYFSGTGNSQWAARRLAEALDDEVVSINCIMKEGTSAPLRSRKPFVFVAPTYAWRLPRVVDRWIRGASFAGSNDAYFVLTCGGSVGNAAAYAQKLCAGVGLRFRGLASVLMPENYLALYDTPDEAECRALIERAKPRIDEVADLVRRGEPLPEEPVTAKGRFRSGPENALFYPVLVHDAKFVATDACTACGTCVRRCPLNNIALAGGKPAWNGSCTHCMACIAGCPTRAIEYDQKSKARHRHDIWTDAGDGACGGDAR